MNANPPRRFASSAVAVVVAGIAIVVLAAVALGRPATPTPSASPSPTPVATPTPDPTAKPTPTPTTKPSEQPTGAIKLDISTGHDVSVLVTDKTGKLTDAKSGRAGDGMTVRWFDTKVENLDDDTLRITWVGLPVDTKIDLGITSANGKLQLTFNQPAPPANSDASGHDRVLILDFAGPVRSEDVTVTFNRS